MELTQTPGSVIHHSFRDTTSEIVGLVSSNLNFSDIHLESGQYAKIYTPNGWIDAPDPSALPSDSDGQINYDAVKDLPKLEPFYQEDIENLLSTLDNEWRVQLESKNFEKGYKALDLHCCRLRINAYLISNRKQIAVTIRRLHLGPMPISEIGLPGFVRTVLSNTKGLIVVSGQTGSGKTTTLAAMVDYINSTQDAHILTIEDPIEYVHTRKRSIITPREVPSDVPSFAEGMKEAMRQKPNVILVGEIRDRETAEVAFLLGESGHLVLCSLHTNTATGAINKLMSMFPRDELDQRARALAESLLMVITQSLIPTKTRDRFVLASEILMNNNTNIAKLIQSPDKHSEIRGYMERSTPDSYTQTMNADLKRLVNENIIERKDALRFSTNKMELEGLLK